MYLLAIFDASLCQSHNCVWPNIQKAGGFT
ncbi:hypothetical protein LUTEI9C_80175 [Luteimonas sp. 9C]|nr:hypothetical protein LUTEI9C_80175 [Luteimonas sp. 9C]